MEKNDNRSGGDAEAVPGGPAVERMDRGGDTEAYALHNVRRRAMRVISEEGLELIPEFRFLGFVPQNCSGMDLALQRMQAASGTASTVLITGETGTGKEVAARTIHENGPRRNQLFVPVNCGSIPADLVESELFGHTKGSFTGAVRDQPGLVFAAEGGTLFLDEIGDMPMPLQLRLLRLLQERMVRPVGATREFPVDIRVIAATHQNLEALMAAGKFREDLYYRLNVVPIHLPPLREYVDDIMALARYILNRECATRQVPPPAIHRKVEAAFQKSSWPGNIRQLGNVIERALALLEGGNEIRPEHISYLATERFEQADGDDSIAARHLLDLYRRFGRGRTLVRFLGDTKEALASVLSASGKDIREGARAMGISVGSFHGILYRNRKKKKT